MKKIFSLIRASMYENMSLFKIKSKNQSKSSKKLLPVFLFIVIFCIILSYANIMIEPLKLVNMEFVLLTLFVGITTILTLLEGLYKSSDLLFKCKDDNLLLSLPIKKSTVLFIRMFKFYVFEVLYNSMYLVPAMIIYAINVKVDITYYISSIIAILLLPIIPIVVSCVVGGFISATSTKFKHKNIAQIIITTLFLLGVLFISFNSENAIQSLAQNASSINDLITKIYYPAGAYTKLVTDFNIQDLIIFIMIHILIFAITIIVLSSLYYKINSKVKTVKSGSKNKNYKIKTNKPIKSLIKKELNRFINTPVFVTNAGFGLVLFMIACIALSFNFEGIIGGMFTQDEEISIEQIKSYVPAVLMALVCIASLMSSITSSMISLEGRAFNIIKSIPVKPFTVIMSKVLTAVLIMIPVLLIGDIIVFINFNFNIQEIIMIIIASFIMPLVCETIGIIVNIKYPRMDAENDTQVVKQSTSSMVSVFAGMILSAVTAICIFMGFIVNIPIDLIILMVLGFYVIMYIVLLIYLNKKSVREFENINI